MDDEQPAREANKICGVCGDRALGYNFNAVSCESCKAFFRRNALKNKDFRCPFTENCTITPVTRRFCQKCRLDKCFSIGMRKEYIMSEEDKVLKRKKIEKNRAKKRSQSDNVKASKIKKDCMDSTFEDTSMSVNSVASTMSETYFWESDRKYADLDGNRQNVVESMSPVTAASVPSPSSPPESTNIAETKTLDMLKEAAHGSKSNFVSRTRLADFNVMPHSVEKDKDSPTSSGKYEQDTLEFNSTFVNTNGESPKYNSQFEENASSYFKFEQSHEPNSNAYVVRVSFTGTSQSDSSLTSQSIKEEATICQKSKETCSSGNNLVAKFKQDPELLSKFISNPNLVAKIFQDQRVIMKIMMDPDLATCFAADPHITQFLKENGAIDATDERTDECNVEMVQQSETPKSDSISSSSGTTTRLKFKGNHVENPILTDLITNRNAEECKNQNSESVTSADWSKNPADVTRDVLQDVQRIPIAANSIESILCEAIKLEYSAFSSLGVNQSSRELNDAERAKLNELIVANKALLAPLDDDITNLVGDECKFKNNFGQSDPMLLDVINLTAIAIRRLIKMAKKINAFKNMCQEDQLALLKGGCTEMMILRSAINYDPDKDMWKIPHSQESMSNIKVDVLKEAKGNLYAEHARFVRTFDPRWRDENIILILSAIALFTPDRPRVVHGDVIKLEQNSYYYLLRRYLESVYPGCEARSTFLKLIQKISELHKLNDEVVGVYLNVNPSSVEPLLIEIFDLKH
ncbi:nuclear hormone receptor HR96 [Odontomachus brunneus]|uniref:nuclear hormone receptor HR96 n=1 Tax=Odontomachus brunneus TaxID=486640 RepID=UPI0013F1BAEF|nr:nuclear hormone receptor HR96 [Odontomachus brunneus]XP_032675245.1 nuclear hormone receptor HR96 [Odontomachus brunneus]